MGQSYSVVALALSLGLLSACTSSSDDSVPEENGDGFDPGIETEEQKCPGVNVTFTQRVPFVMLLVDQSSSMEESFGNGSRWSVLREALLDESNGIINGLDEDVRLGLALYSSENGMEGGECPLISSVDAQFGNYEAIRSLYDAAAPVDDTPTAESIVAVATELEKVYVNNATPKAIVLATDGYPDTCAQPDPQDGQDESIEAARTAFSMGMRTHVISVGDELGEEHLQDMADAGAGFEPGGANHAKFYRALDNGELYEAFSDVINGVRDCVFTLDGTVVSGYEDQGEVRVDGELLVKDDPNGWRLNGSQEVELLGEACTTIQEGDHELHVDFPCGGYEAPPVY